MPSPIEYTITSVSKNTNVSVSSTVITNMKANEYFTSFIASMIVRISLSRNVSTSSCANLIRKNL